MIFNCRSLLLVVATAVFLTGCATATPQLSPMQMRQFTTRMMDGGYENVFRATMTVLQDNGYIIKNTDMAAGLVVANIDRETSKASQLWQAMWAGYAWNKGTQIELSATISKLNEAQTEIRMIIQEVNYSQYNSKNSIKTITDPKVYESLLNDILIEVKRREAINKS